MFQVNSKDTRMTRIVKFEHISHNVEAFPLLSVNM